MAEIHAHGEGRPLGLRVGGDHEGEIEGIGPLRQQRDADHPGGVGQEEGDVLRRGGLGGHDQIALILPVFIVDHHGHAESTYGVNGFLHR